MSRTSTPPRVTLPDLLAGLVEQRDDLEAVVAEPRVVGEGEPQVPRAEDDDALPSVEAEDLLQVAPQVPT